MPIAKLGVIINISIAEFYNPYSPEKEVPYGKMWSYPMGIAVGRKGRRIYVGDKQKGSVFIFRPNGVFIGELVARSLATNSTSLSAPRDSRQTGELIVCNRSYDRAQRVASQFGGRAAPFEKLTECMSLIDLVVSCTSAPDYIITKEQLMSIIETRAGKPIFLIDLAVPRDIEPEVSQLKQVYLYNVDDLQSIVNETLNERKLEAQKAERIIEKAVDNFLKWLNSRSAIPIIKALREKGEEIRDIEIEQVLRKLQPLTEREEKILRSMANSIVNKLLHTPVIQLRKYAQTEQGHLYAEILRNLFDLSVQIDYDIPPHQTSASQNDS